MKPIGKIKISERVDGSAVMMFQFDFLNDELDYQAPVGSFAFDVPQNVFGKIGPKKTDWQRTTKRLFLSDSLDWFFDLLSFGTKDRTELKNIALEGIETFVKGEETEEGSTIKESFLDKNKFDFIGFVPHISYVLEKKRQDQNDTKVIWQHPFSQTTLLYKSKNLPFLIISNGNLDYNSSRIEKNIKNNTDSIIGISG